MATPFIAEIRMFGFGFAPRNWAFCNGGTLGIQQNQALFSLVGTTYGGNGTTNFMLPNLQGRVPLHSGNGASSPGLTPRALGATGGSETVTLTTQQLAAHNHPATGSSAAATLGPPDGNLWAQGPYSTTPNNSMAQGDTTNTGGGQAHENRSPYTVVNFCIALTGIFPSRN